MDVVLLIIPLLFLGVYVGIIWATVSVANSKGQNAVLWGFLALFLGIVALLIVAILPAGNRNYD